MVKEIDMPGKRGRPPKKAPETTEEPKVLTSQAEVCAELKMSPYQFCNLVKKYPISEIGAPGKINGRWHISVEDIWRWYRYVQAQEIRHPDSRRMRPDEPPDIKAIRAR